MQRPDFTYVEEVQKYITYLPIVGLPRAHTEYHPRSFLPTYWNAARSVKRLSKSGFAAFTPVATRLQVRRSVLRATSMWEPKM